MVIWIELILFDCHPSKFSQVGSSAFLTIWAQQNADMWETQENAIFNTSSHNANFNKQINKKLKHDAIWSYHGESLEYQVLIQWIQPPIHVGHIDKALHCTMK